MDKNIVFDVGHIAAHYLEASIPREEWESMPPEKAFGICKDIEAVFAGKMSASEFGKKYGLPRK